MTYIVKAGRMLRLIGWLLVVCVCAIALAFAIPYLHDGSASGRSELVAVLPRLIAIGALAIAYLMVGAILKRERRTAVALCAGWVLSIFALIMFPVGTVIELLAAFYLVKSKSTVAPAV